MELFELDELYASLPAYQSESLKALVEKNGEMKAAELWLTTCGPELTSQFGGEGKKDNYFVRVKHQLDQLICGDKDWTEEREEFGTFGKTLQLTTAAAIAAKIAPLVSLSPALLTAPVALMLHSICKIGIRAYCVNKNIANIT